MKEHKKGTDTHPQKPEKYRNEKCVKTIFLWNQFLFQETNQIDINENLWPYRKAFLLFLKQLRSIL